MAIYRCFFCKQPINYICNDVINMDKTTEKLIAFVKCRRDTFCLEMKCTASAFRKRKTKRTYWHYVVALPKNTTITAEELFEVSQKFLIENPKFQGYERFMAAHITQSTLHVHFVLNAFSYTGKNMFHFSPWDLIRTRKYFIKVAKQCGFDV